MNTAIRDFHIVAKMAGEDNQPVQISANRLVELSDEITVLEEALKIEIGMAQWYFAQVKNRDAEIVRLRAENAGLKITPGDAKLREMGLL